MPPGGESGRCYRFRRHGAPGYSKRAAEFLGLARCAPLPAVRKRYLMIVEHYRKLAEVEKRVQIKKSQPTLVK
jgi:hypothetical protein